MGFWTNQYEKSAVLNLLKRFGATTAEANEIQKLLTIPILKQFNPIIEYVGKEARIVLLAYVATAFMQEALRLNLDARKGTFDEDAAKRAHRDAVCYYSDIRLLLIEGRNNGAISEVVRNDVDNFIEHVINSTQVKEEAQSPKKSVKEAEKQASTENKEANKILQSLSSEGREMAEILMLHAEVAAEKSYYGLPFSDYQDWALSNHPEAIGVTQAVERVLASCEAHKHSAKTAGAYKAYVCRIAANYVKVHEGQLLSDTNDNLERDTKKDKPTPKPTQKPTVQKKNSGESSGVAWKLVLLLVICIVFTLVLVKADKSTQKTQQVASEKPVQKPVMMTQQNPTKQKPSLEEQCRSFGALVAAQHDLRGSGMSYEEVMERIVSEGFSEDLTSVWEKATAIAYGTEVYYAPARASIRNQAEAECIEAMSKK